MADSGIGSDRSRALVGGQRVRILREWKATNKQKINILFRNGGERVIAQENADKTLLYQRNILRAMDETRNKSFVDRNGVKRTSIRYRSELLIFYSYLPAVMKFLYSQRFLLKKIGITDVLPSPKPSLWVPLIIVGAEKNSRDFVVSLIKRASFASGFTHKVFRLDEWHKYYKCENCFNFNERQKGREYYFWHFTEDCVRCSFCLSFKHKRHACLQAINRSITFKGQPASSSSKIFRRLREVQRLNIPSMIYWRHPYYNVEPALSYSVSLPNDFDQNGKQVKRIVVSMAYGKCDGINGTFGTEIIIHGKGKKKIKIQMIYHAFVNNIINLVSDQSENRRTSLIQMERGIDIETMRREVIAKLRNRYVIVHNKTGIFEFCGLTEDVLRENNIRYLDLGLAFQEPNRIKNDSFISCELLTLLIQGKEINGEIRDNFPRPIVFKTGEPFRPRYSNIDVESRSIFKNFIAINNLAKTGQKLRDNLNINYLRAWEDLEMAAREKREINYFKFERKFNDVIAENRILYLINPDNETIEKYARRHSNCKKINVIKLRQSLKFECERCDEEKFRQCFNY